jgi:opacity protein-like surface antigen
MRTWLLAGAASVFLTGSALAETSVSRGPDNVPLLPPVLSLAQPSVTNAEKPDMKSLVGVPLKLDFGKGFGTEVEGATLTTSNQRLGNLPTSGGVSATSVMFNALYEIRDGAWHLKPFIGGGFGMVDTNSRVLGVTNNDWATAYQLHGGLSLGFSQKIVGNLEYRWTEGSKPDFGIAGSPVRPKFSINSHSVFIGVNYKY